MSQQITTNQAEQQQLDALLEKLHAEIDFAAKSLDINKQDFTNILNGSLATLNNLLIKFENILQQASDQHEKQTKDLATFTILPEKIASNIAAVVPQLASALENIHTPHVIGTKNQFSSIQQNLATEITNYHSKLTEITNNCLDKAVIISTKSRKKFFTSLAVMVIFSAIVSSITSYFVTNKFPRYVAIQGVNDLTIHDSRVVVHDSTKELKEQKANKTQQPR